MESGDPSSTSRRSLRARNSSAASGPATPAGSESPRSDISDGRASRSSRLSNPEFAAKHKAFMAKVTAASKGSMDSYLSTEMATEGTATTPTGLKRRASPRGEETVKRRRSTKTNSSGLDILSDGYCWTCHKEGDVICCETCPRVFHLKCIQLESSPAEDWVCPECVLIMTAENMDTRSRAMRLLTVDQLCTLLKHALARMKSVLNIEPFLKPVDPVQFPAYKDYISCPMDMQSMERNIRRKQYGSTEAMLADCKWILHNCIIFNSPSSKLTSIAKSIVKVCKHEMQEVENCPDCYLNAHIKKDTWFTEACRFPHPLVWAKLKGFPFWPGKIMRVNSENNADIRFFGAHDRAWIPLKDVYLYSEKPPQEMKKKRGNLDSCVTEVATHIKKLKDRFGKFDYASHKTQYDPNKEEEMLKILFPKYTLPFEIGTLARRARSYSFTGSERSRDATPTPSETSMIDDDEEEEEEEIEEHVEKHTPGSGSLNAIAAAAKEINELSKKEFIKGDKKVEKIHVAMMEVEPEKAVTTVKAAETVTQVETEETLAQVETEETVTQVEAEKTETKVEADEILAPVETEETTMEVENKEIIKEVEADTVDTCKLDKSTSIMVEEVEMKDLNKITNVDLPVPESPQVPAPNPAEARVCNTEATRVSASPPCEVSSTTITPGITEIEPSKETPVSKPKFIEGIIAETSEPVIIEEDEDDLDEIDDVEPQGETEAVNVIESCPDEEPAVSKKDKKLTESSNLEPELKNTDKNTQPQTKTIPTEDENVMEEIDDVEPLTDTGSLNQVDSKKTIDPTKLLASGVSITVIDKKKKEEITEEVSKEEAFTETSSKGTGDLELGSDISVTVVQKQKTESTSGKFTLSLKSESELLDPVKTACTGGVEKKTFPRKSLTEDDKTPPDPIVTISKVSSMKDSKEGLKVPQFSASEKDIKKPQISSPPVPRLQSPAHPASSPSPGMMGPRISGFRGPHPMGPRGHMMNLMPGQVMVRGQYRGPHPGPMGLPSLQPRPTGPLSVPPSLPSSAGPVADQLNRVAGKLADYMRQNLEDLFKDLSQQGSPEATIKGLQMELEKMQWRHQQELAEVKHNADLILMEMRGSMEQEKQRSIADCRKQSEIDKQKAIAETKKKQWCANCGKEAIFYCCWNTSYCDYPCQQSHWPNHMSSCAQNNADQSEEEPQDHGPQAHFMANTITSAGMGGGPRMAAASSGRGMRPGHMRMPHRGRMPGPGVPTSMAGMRFSIRPTLPGQMTFTRPYFM